MRYLAPALPLLLVAQCAAAKSPFDGMWLTCLPAQGRYSLLTVAPQASGFRVTSETGAIWSFSGEGRLVSGELIVRGCHFSRDEPIDGCNPDQPPVAFTMKSSEFGEQKLPLRAALRRSIPIRTSEKGWERLAKLCEEVGTP
jgi:hypothetical protein